MLSFTHSHFLSPSLPPSLSLSPPPPPLSLSLLSPSSSLPPSPQPPPPQPQNPWLRHRVVGGAPAAVPGPQFHQPHAPPGQFFMPMAAGFPPQFAGGFQPPPAPAPGGPAHFPQYYQPFGAGYAHPHMAHYWNQYNQYPRYVTVTTVRMAGNLTRVLIWRFGDFKKSPSLEPPNIAHMRSVSIVAKF